MEREILNVPHWKRPAGYSHLVKTSGGSTLYLAGQVAEDAQGNLIGKGDICRQFDQIMSNISEVLNLGGAELSHVVKMTIYCADREQYMANLKEIGRIYQKHFGKHYPAMTLVEVKSLFSPYYFMEIDVTAVV